MGWERDVLSPLGRVTPVEMTKRNTFANRQGPQFHFVIGNNFWRLFGMSFKKKTIKYNEMIPDPK